VKSDLGDKGGKRLALSRVATRDGADVVSERVELPVRSGKDPIELLLEAAEELCLERQREGVYRIDASDVRAFVIPRLDELLDSENDELRFVLTAKGGEKVSEHTVTRAIAKGEWPTKGSVTLEAAVLAVKLAALAREAAKNGEGLLLELG
jgi:hypothetical protein